MLRVSEINESTIVNMGSGRSTLMRDFVELYWNKLGGDRELLCYSERKKGEEIKTVRMSADRIYRLTGWIPSMSLEEGVINTIREMHKLIKNEN